MTKQTKNQLIFAAAPAIFASLIVLAVGASTIALVAVPVSVFALVFLSVRGLAYLSQKKKIQAKENVANTAPNAEVEIDTQKKAVTLGTIIANRYKEKSKVAKPEETQALEAQKKSAAKL